jgi:glycosyltransferase involved in cell wall biosynthesis
MTQTICYVLAEFPVLSETFVTNEIRAMRARGHRIVPVALTDFAGPCQPEDEAMRDEAVKLSDISRRALFGIRPDRLGAAWRFIRAQKGLSAHSLLLAGAKVAQVIRREGARHVHAHFAHSSAATAIVAARLAGVTVSFIGHGCDIYGGAVDLAAKLAEADLVFATCKDMAQDFHALCPAANVVVTSCGIDPDRFAPADGPRNGRLLAIGRLAEQKGYPVLLAALALLPPARRPVIDVIGTGPLEAQLKAEALRLGVAGSINFCGARPSAWIASAGPAYLGLVAPFVICRNGDRDTGPVVVKEALAMGLPVVATALMGMKEMVTPECGRQIAIGDAAALAEALVWIKGLDDATRARMAAAGRARVRQHYTLAGQAAAMTAAIEQMQGRVACAA